MIIINFFITSKLDTTNIVVTCDYLNLNKEIDSGNPREMFMPSAGRKLCNKLC